MVGVQNSHGDFSRNLFRSFYLRGGISVDHCYGHTTQGQRSLQPSTRTILVPSSECAIQWTIENNRKMFSIQNVIHCSVSQSSSWCYPLNKRYWIDISKICNMVKLSRKPQENQILRYVLSQTYISVGYLLLSAIIYFSRVSCALSLQAVFHRIMLCTATQVYMISIYQ